MSQKKTKNVQYDDYAKFILSQKEILSRILKFTIKEFEDMEAEDIMELIEGEPLVSKVSTEPGETNQTFHGKITGNNTESTELEEGTIIFDIIFYVRMKDGVSRIIINLEAQGIEKPPYPLVNRTIFYIARLISSQKNRNFDHSNYGDMLRTYSIWICFNLEENCMNYLHLTNTSLFGTHEWLGDLELMNIFLVGLDKNLSEEALKTTDSNLHYMLGTIFSNDLSPRDKVRLLSEREDMPAGTHIRKELDTMCNLSYGIEEQGIEKGIEKGRMDLIKNMLSKHMPVEDIMKYSGATEEEIRKAEEQLCISK